MGYLLTKDFLHIIFHIDKGILYTVKELALRPGHSIREYIQGKRVKHFNYLSLLVVLVGLGQILYQYPILHVQDSGVSEGMSSFSAWYDRNLSEFPKLVKLAQIPVFALITWLLFRRAKLNFAEHLVLNAYIMAFMMLVGFICDAIIAFTNNAALIEPLHSLNVWLWIVYCTVFYFQFFSAYPYKKAGLFIRSLASPFLAMVLTAVLLMGVYVIATHASAEQIKALFN